MEISTDILVIGSGAAGLNFSLDASQKAKVVIVTKKELFSSNTNRAQGGIAAVMSPEDDFELHVKDTLKLGRGLCDEKAVRIMVSEAPKQIMELIQLGVKFSQKGKELALSREAGHSKARIIHAHDTTGKAIESALVNSTRDRKNIKILENHIAFELLMKDNRCIGARILDVKGTRCINVFAKVTVLATGGIGQLYHYNTNPNISTGDGIALAYRAGASISDIEFIQFHPTMLDITPNPNFLISETLRGEGGILVNEKGQRFMKKYHAKLELAPRDIVARSIINERKTGRVFVDMTHLKADYVKDRFPAIYKRCLAYGIDITKDKIPVIPAAHYVCGGIKTDHDGATDIACLLAFGETACTGVHGANRLASNSLLESLVFSERAFRKTIKIIKGIKLKTNSISSPAVCSAYGKMKGAKRLKHKVRKIMWDNVGIIRNDKGLKEAADELMSLSKKADEMLASCISRDTIEASNMALLSVLIARAAMQRKESRGTHHNDDHPKESSRWKRHIVLRA